MATFAKDVGVLPLRVKVETTTPSIETLLFNESNVFAGFLD